MKLFDVFGLLSTELRPERTKLHLAAWDGRHDPLHEFIAGRFESWQAWQGRRNFERPYIVALAPLPGPDRWLLVGCFNRLGREWVTDPGPPHWNYLTAEVTEMAALVGRAVVGFKRPGRASYLDADRWAGSLQVRAIQERRHSVAEFPGYDRILLTKAQLDLIVAHRVDSWWAALSAVAGIYLITDTKNGRLYVGSATGDGGIWSRWSQYAANGHGGNADLRAVVEQDGTAHATNFTFSVLEIADTHTGVDAVLRRESHWKTVLRTREHGYNKN